MKYEQNTNLQHHEQAMFDTFNGLNFHQGGIFLIQLSGRLCNRKFALILTKLALRVSSGSIALSCFKISPFFKDLNSRH